MTDQAKKARNEYYKEWRKKHPNKQQEYNRRYWERKVKEAELDNEQSG